MKWWRQKRACSPLADLGGRLAQIGNLKGGLVRAVSGELLWRPSHGEVTAGLCRRHNPLEHCCTRACPVAMGGVQGHGGPVWAGGANIMAVLTARPYGKFNFTSTRAATRRRPVHAAPAGSGRRSPV